MHTRRGHYAPCFVDGHVLIVTKVTHPFVTFHEKIITLLVSVGVVVSHTSQNNGFLGTKLYMPDLSRTVTVEKIFHRQPTHPLNMASYKTSMPRKTL